MISVEKLPIFRQFCGGIENLLVDTDTLSENEKLNENR